MQAGSGPAGSPSMASEQYYGTTSKREIFGCWHERSDGGFFAANMPLLVCSA
jgi:hypothetical protein